MINGYLINFVNFVLNVIYFFNVFLLGKNFFLRDFIGILNDIDLSKVLVIVIFLLF